MIHFEVTFSLIWLLSIFFLCLALFLQLSSNPQFASHLFLCAFCVCVCLCAFFPPFC